MSIVECAYCPSTTDMTSDHVPPKGIFSKPRPSDLITVPACRTCNASFQTDDEYFRTTLGIREEVEDLADIARLGESVQRDLRRPQKQALVDWVRRGSHVVRLFGPSGQVVFEKSQFLVNETRLKSVVWRTVRGLYWHETRCKLPSALAVRVFSFREIDQLQHGLRDEVVQMRAVVASSPPTAIARGQFVYQSVCAPLDEDPTGGWITIFYGRIGYFTAYRPETPA